MVKFSRIIDEANERKYWTQIPNLIDDLQLDPYEFRLYVHLKRVAGDDGKCWQSTQTLADHCRISTGKVSKAKKSLELKKLITIEQRPSYRGKPHHLITIVDIWPANMAYYSKESSTDAGITSPGEIISSPHEVITSPGEIKNNTLRKTQQQHNKKNPNVVVSLSPSQKQSYDTLISIGITKKAARQLAKKHESSRIFEVCKAAETKEGITDKSAWIVSALKEGWEMQIPENNPKIEPYAGVREL